MHFKTKRVPVFMFDMAGVLLNFDLGSLKRKVANSTGISFEVISDSWMPEKYIQAELGEISSEEYLTFYKKETGLTWSYEKWIKEWTNICEPNEPGLTLFKNIKKKGHNLYILSNLAECHKIAAEQKYPGFWQITNQNFLSYELGLLKPDSDIYKTVCSQLNKQPDECFFFDDREENVISAKNVGLRAFQFSNGNLGNIINELKAFGIE